MRNFSNRPNIPPPRNNISQQMIGRNDLIATNIAGGIIIGSRQHLPQRGPNPLGPNTMNTPLYDPTQRWSDGNDAGRRTL